MDEISIEYEVLKGTKLKWNIRSSEISLVIIEVPKIYASYGTNGFDLSKECEEISYPQLHPKNKKPWTKQIAEEKQKLLKKWVEDFKLRSRYIDHLKFQFHCKNKQSRYFYLRAWIFNQENDAKFPKLNEYLQVKGGSINENVILHWFNNLKRNQPASFLFWLQHFCLLKNFKLLECFFQRDFKLTKAVEKIYFFKCWVLRHFLNKDLVNVICKEL